MEVKDLDLNLTDATARDYANELLDNLVKLHNDFDTHAMATNAQSFLQGKKEMLGELITYMRRTI